MVVKLSPLRLVLPTPVVQIASHPQPIVAAVLMLAAMRHTPAHHCVEARH